MCQSGSGRLLLITGPAGVGKTSLLDVCARNAEHRLDVLRVQADAVSAGGAFAAIRELLEPAVRAAGDAVWDGAAGLARSVFDSGGSERLDRDRAASVMHGLYWLLAGVAERRPLVLLIDDAHWLDAASLRFLSYLARRVESLPVLVALTARRGEGRRIESLAVGVSQARATILEPSPLGPDAVATLLRRVVGAGVDEALCEACRRATGGNPFYLLELARGLAAEPSVCGTLASGRSPAPGAIVASVAERLSALGADCTALAQAAAILGAGALLHSAAALAELERDAAARAADRLRAAGVLAGDMRLAFVHPIVQEAIVAEITPSRRAALHARAAAQLVSEGRTSDLAAAHLLSAEPYGESWVVDVLRTAAREALSNGAPEVAMAYLRRAVAEPPSPEQRVVTMVELGRAETLLLRGGEFASLRQAVSLADGPQNRAELTLELAEALIAVTDLRGAYALLAGILDHPDDVDPAVLVRAEASLIAGGLADLTADGIGDRVARCAAQVRRGEIEEPRMLAALALTGAAVGLGADEVASLAVRAVASEDLVTELWSAWVGAAMALVYADRLDQAAQVVGTGLGHAERLGALSMFVAISWAGAQAAFRAGDLRGAAAHGERALEVLSEDELPGRWILATHVATLLELGRAPDALRLARDTAPPADGLADARDVVLLAARGLARTSAGELQRGVADVLAADDCMSAAGRSLSLFLDWVPSVTRVLVLLGRRPEAELIAERELAAAIAFGAPRRHGVALSTYGTVIPGPSGIRALREAVELLADTPARLEHARALVNLGAGLGARGELPLAREVLSDGLDIANRCAGAALCDRARAELVAAGARPRRNARSGPDALTPAERRTATMAADGLTNRQIAQALFVSVKTVEGQLAAAYPKLGIHSRRELARVLRETETGR